MSENTPIQAVFSGYLGKPCTLYSLYNAQSDVLVISKEGAHTRERFRNSVLITNDDRMERDVLFDEKADMLNAIKAFFTLKTGLSADGASPRLVFHEKVTRASPDNAIEKDGMDENGVRYRVSESISNLQIAVLATCAYTINVEGVANTVEFCGVMEKILRGEAVSL